MALYKKNRKRGMREVASVARMPAAGGIKTTRVMIDSRDRDVAAFPSANHFSVMLLNKPRLILRVEIASAEIPLLNGCDARYVVITETHCTDVLVSPAGLMFGTNTGVTGCTFPSGVLAVIPLKRQFAAPANPANYVWWQNGKLLDNWTTSNLQGVNTSFDRLNFDVWIWNSSHTAVPYPLPTEAVPPVVPAADNNIFLVVVMTCEE
jgi:hypothetical protein